MQELTEILTVEITTISKSNNGHREYSDTDIRDFEKEFKEVFEVDNVKVTNVQNFVRDIET